MGGGIGFIEGPIMITHTHSVGVVRDAVIAWERKKQGPLAVMAGQKLAAGSVP